MSIEFYEPVAAVREVFPDATEQEIEKFELLMEHGMLPIGFVTQLIFGVADANKFHKQPASLGETVDAIVTLILEFASFEEFEASIPHEN